MPENVSEQNFQKHLRDIVAWLWPSKPINDVHF